MTEGTGISPIRALIVRGSPRLLTLAMSLVTRKKILNCPMPWQRIRNGLLPPLGSTGSWTGLEKQWRTQKHDGRKTAGARFRRTSAAVSAAHLTDGTRLTSPIAVATRRLVSGPVIPA